MATAIALAVIDDRGKGRVCCAEDELGHLTPAKDWIGEIGKAAHLQSDPLARPEETFPAESASEPDDRPPMVCTSSRLREELCFIAPFAKDGHHHK